MDLFLHLAGSKQLSLLQWCKESQANQNTVLIRLGRGRKWENRTSHQEINVQKKKNLNNGFETRAGEMTTWLTALASKSHGQSLTPRPHVVKRKKQPHQSVLYLLHSCHGIRACVYAHAHTQLVDIFLEI